MVCMKKSNYSVGSIPRGILARNCEAAEQLRRKYYCRKKSLQILLGVIEKESVLIALLSLPVIAQQQSQ